MSELARNEHGEEWTAFELKDEYLRHGTQFEWFVCAFCDTPVSPAAVYGDTYVKAPYFTLAEKGNHHTDVCPYGAAGLAAYNIERPAPARAHEFEVDLPERLVPIRANRPAGGAHDNKPLNKAKDAEVRARVGARTATLTIANQYTTSLLQTLAAARAAAMSALFRKADRDGKSSGDRVSFVFAELKKHPLNLYGKQLNYGSAFHKTDHEPWDGQFIYYGDAKVRSIADGFELTSEQSIPLKETETKIPVRIVVQCDRAHPANRMEARTIDTLTTLEAADKSAHWLAYGELKLNEEKTAYELFVCEPGHFYART